MSNEYFDPKLKIFSLNSNRELAEEIAKEVGIELGNQVLLILVMEKSKLTLKKVSVVVMYMLFNQRVIL